MAGELYLGSQKVCPVIVVNSGGGSSKYGCTVDNFIGDVDASGYLQIPGDTEGDITFTGIKYIDINYALYYKFYENTNLTHAVSFPDLEEITGSLSCGNAFSGCSFITSVSFPKLKVINASSACSNMFSSCSRITSASFPELETIDGSYSCMSMFASCSYLTTVSFPKLAYLNNSAVAQYMFSNCARLTDLYFNALTTTSFGSYTNQFENLVSGSGYTSGGITIHFPSNLSSVISGLSGYPNFGASSGIVTLAFDLPSTS